MLAKRVVPEFDSSLMNIHQYSFINQPLPIEETKMILQVLADQFDLPSEHMLLMEGTPKHQIIECINELEVDLLLVGSRTNPILQAEITHLTHYLADHSPCNMMLMRPLGHDF